MKDMISRNDAYNTLTEYYHHTTEIQHKALREALERVPDSQPELIERESYIRGFEQGKTQGRLDMLSAQPERLTDDDFETIRIHLNAQKEKLCNQHRWEEANEYQRILDRFMAFASAQPEPPEWAQKVDEYRKSAPSFVRNQLVWALYQTWKEYDGRLVHQRGKENR